LIELNKVPGFELQELKEYTRGSATRDTALDQLLKRQHLGATIIDVHVLLENIKDSNRVLVPFGGAVNYLITSSLTRRIFVICIRDKVIHQA
jgi:hypothetical protein